MPILTNPSFAARTAVIYITTGALIDVWSGIWLWYLRNTQSGVHTSWYWCFGFLFTGLTLIIIGCAIGQIGRSARAAELPPQEVTRAVSQAEQNAAARAPVMLPVSPAVGGAMPATAPLATTPMPAAPVAPLVTQPVSPKGRSTG